MKKSHTHQKRVLIVTYIFPPAGGAGVQRPAKFVKYLREYGWNPVVLTCSNPSVPAVDAGLGKDLPEDIEIFKARTFEPSYKQKTSFVHAGNEKNLTGVISKCKKVVKTIVGYLLIPDVQILWWPGLIWALVRVFIKGNVDCVFVTAPPFSSLLPVVVLCKLFGIKVVADFRDEWTFNRKHLENAARNVVIDRLDVLLERVIVRYADIITVASKQYILSIDRRHPKIGIKNKCEVITNGFDEDDFKGIVREIRENSKQLQIVYSGTVWSATSLRNFIISIDILLQEKPQLKDFLIIKIIGRVVDKEKEYFLKESLKGVIQLEGYCSHKRVLTEIVNADVLLLTLTNTAAAERIIPAKTFEYMATGNPILAIVPDGEVKSLLAVNYPGAQFADPNDVEKIRKTIELLIAEHQVNRLIVHDESSRLSVEQFSRIFLTKELAEIFNKIIAK